MACYLQMFSDIVDYYTNAELRTNACQRISKTWQNRVGLNLLVVRSRIFEIAALSAGTEKTRSGREMQVRPIVIIPGLHIDVACCR